MKVLWERPGTVAQVRESLPRPLAYTTVMTVLERMIAKGVVARRKKGRSYVYSPVLDLESARSQAVQHLLTNLFGGDADTLMRYVTTSSGGVLQSRPSQNRARTGHPSAAMDDTLL
jgi:predicted transcriptional regulator